MKQCKTKAIVFDLDGTLMNTKQGILASLDQVIEKNGLASIPFADKRRFVGPPMAQCMQNYFGLDDDTAKRYALEFREIYPENCLLARTYPHIRLALATLKLEGYKLAVATYKRQDVTEKVLDHFKLSRYFDAICGSDFECKMKKVQIVENAVNQIGASKERTILVGDTTSDASAALAFGCLFLPVTYGYGFIQDKETAIYNPVDVCHSVDDLVGIVRKTFKKLR